MLFMVGSLCVLCVLFIVWVWSIICILLSSVVVCVGGWVLWFVELSG